VVKKGVSQKFFICQTALKLLKKICQNGPIESDVTILRIQLVNQQTESMTEKFFERALFSRLFQLNCGKSRVWGLGAKRPKYNNKKIPLSFGLLPLKKGDRNFYPNTHSQSTISANSVSSSTHSNIIMHLLKYVFQSFQQTKSSQADKHDS
jgi:hypothetical protein